MFGIESISNLSSRDMYVRTEERILLKGQGTERVRAYKK